MKNPLSAQNDIDELVAELQKENSDAKTVTKLQLKILGKGIAQGFLISSGAVLALVGAAALAGRFIEIETEETEEEDLEEIDD